MKPQQIVGTTQPVPPTGPQPGQPAGVPNTENIATKIDVKFASQKLGTNAFRDSHRIYTENLYNIGRLFSLADSKALADQDQLLFQQYRDLHNFMKEELDLKQSLLQEHEAAKQASLQNERQNSQKFQNLIHEIRHDSKNVITNTPDYISQAKEHQFYNESQFELSLKLVNLSQEEGQKQKPFSFISEENDEETIQNITEYESTLINNQ